MLPTQETILRESKKVYNALSQKMHCTFNELQNICHLGSVNLCMSLIELIREEQIIQFSTPNGIYYAIQNTAGRARS